MRSTPSPSLSASVTILRSNHLPSRARPPQAPVMSQVPTLIVSPPSSNPPLPPTRSHSHPSRSSSTSSGITTPPHSPHRPLPTMPASASAPASAPVPVNTNAYARSSMSTFGDSSQMAEVELPPPSYSEIDRQQEGQRGLPSQSGATPVHFAGAPSVQRMGQNGVSQSMRAPPPPCHPTSFVRRGVPTPHPMFLPEPSCARGRHTYVMKYGVSNFLFDDPTFTSPPLPRLAHCFSCGQISFIGMWHCICRTPFPRGDHMSHARS